jgi:drug/metabolite transporter (DMT)-like permease
MEYFSLEGPSQAERKQTEQLKRWDQFMQENAFILYALVSAMCYAVHSYITAYAMTRWRNSFTVLFPEGFILIIGPLLYHLVRAKWVVYPQTGKYWTPSHSVFFIGGVFNTPALLNVLTRGFSADFVPITIAISTFYSKEIGLSPAVVQSFTTLSSFMTAVGFYFSFGEKLSVQHIMGMLMILGSVAIVAISKSLQQADDV